MTRGDSSAASPWPSPSSANSGRKREDLGMSCTGPAAEARDLGTLRGFELRVASDEADDMAGNDRQGFVSRQGGFQCRHEPGATAAASAHRTRPRDRHHKGRASVSRRFQRHDLTARGSQWLGATNTLHANSTSRVASEEANPPLPPYLSLRTRHKPRISTYSGL